MGLPEWSWSWISWCDLDSCSHYCPCLVRHFIITDTLICPFLNASVNFDEFKDAVCTSLKEPPTKSRFSRSVIGVSIIRCPSRLHSVPLLLRDTPAPGFLIHSTSALERILDFPRATFPRVVRVPEAQSPTDPKVPRRGTLTVESVIRFSRFHWIFQSFFSGTVQSHRSTKNLIFRCRVPGVPVAP